MRPLSIRSSGSLTADTFDKRKSGLVPEHNARLVQVVLDSVNSNNNNNSSLKDCFVFEKYKLIFVPIQKSGSTVWKQLFRKILGRDDWYTGRPVSVSRRYKMSSYTEAQATQLMNDPTYTRAIFVRDPKERFLSAYLDKGLKTKYAEKKCCNGKRNEKSGRELCTKQLQTFSGFVNVTRSCHDTHWLPQSTTGRLEPKYVPLLNFVGHLETAFEDAKRLLQRVGAWEEHGKTGWGLHGNETIFQSKSYVKHKTSHSTTNEASKDRFLARYYTPELEEEIEKRFQDDYRTLMYNFTLKKIDFSVGTKNNHGRDDEQ
jgi:hypothetical protein